MLVEIKNRAGEIIITGEYESVKDACEKKSKKLMGANLTGAYLTDAYLTGADLTGAYLTDANLTDANLTSANLWGADLKGAYLKGAYLTGANLTDADLKGAYLRGAYLTDANLMGANLTGADLTDAKGIILPVITITGSSHLIFYIDGKIRIGCIEKTVAEWLLEYEKIGKENKYTDEQRKEYKKYIDMIALLENDKT